MRYAAWVGLMNHREPGEDSTFRDSMRQIVSMPRHPRRAYAIQMLKGPAFPERLAYLWDWVREIRNGLGADMNGLASLTWAAVSAWSHQTDERPKPHEVRAIFMLGAILRNPRAMEPSNG